MMSNDSKIGLVIGLSILLALLVSGFLENPWLS